jgi:hypothetical protein
MDKIFRDLNGLPDSITTLMHKCESLIYDRKRNIQMLHNIIMLNKMSVEYLHTLTGPSLTTDDVNRSPYTQRLHTLELSSRTTEAYITEDHTFIDKLKVSAYALKTLSTTKPPTQIDQCDTKRCGICKNCEIDRTRCMVCDKPNGEYYCWLCNVPICAICAPEGTHSRTDSKVCGRKLDFRCADKKTCFYRGKYDIDKLENPLDDMITRVKIVLNEIDTYIKNRRIHFGTY